MGTLTSQNLTRTKINTDVVIIEEAIEPIEEDYIK